MGELTVRICHIPHLSIRLTEPGIIALYPLSQEATKLHSDFLTSGLPTARLEEAHLHCYPS